MQGPTAFFVKLINRVVIKVVDQRIDRVAAIIALLSGEGFDKHFANASSSAFGQNCQTTAQNRSVADLLSLFTKLENSRDEQSCHFYWITNNHGKGS
jgi:hypothetical protein